MDKHSCKQTAPQRQSQRHTTHDHPPAEVLVAVGAVPLSSHTHIAATPLSCQTWEKQHGGSNISHRTQQRSRDSPPPRMRLEAPGQHRRGAFAPGHGQHAHRSLRTRAARRCAHSAMTIGASTAIDSSAIGMPIALCSECSVAPAVAGVSVVISPAMATAAAELSAQSIW